MSVFDDVLKFHEAFGLPRPHCGRTPASFMMIRISGLQGAPTVPRSVRRATNED